ncbi:metalloregulator ArsR/SmtB family transcription factor [Clostridium rectalis]|uniref:metalloregulator ArsR/SmtB family transcription factor n=1 Tax=Clostridium rectalis TaxID=2040295 RepID=UPI000F630869
MNKYIDVFKAIGDENRINILNLICDKSICAKGIAKHLNITEAAVSQHIRVLKDANLIIGYKLGYHIIYDINNETFKESIAFIENIIHKDESYKNKLEKGLIKDSNNLDCFKKCIHKKCTYKRILKEELFMKICFPVKNNEGLESIPYGHFGSAPSFVIVNLENNDIKVVGNGDLNHEHGKCQPIKALSGENVDAVIVGGIGAGAIMKLNSMGVKVFKAAEGTIKENLDMLKSGVLKEFPSNHTCNHHGCGH